MMSLLERLLWLELHATIWKANPGAVGLTEEQALALAAKVQAAREAYEAAQVARNAAKAATLAQKSAFNTMDDASSDAIRYIRAYAASRPTAAERDAVFVAAQINPPAPPTPAGPPVPPADVVGDPNADGTVTLKWKGSIANQTFFTVWRRTGNNTTWQQVGAVASKKFIDATVPRGTPSVVYTIKAQRNTEVSAPSAEATVNFGAAA